MGSVVGAGRRVKIAIAILALALGVLMAGTERRDVLVGAALVLIACLALLAGMAR